MRNNYTEDSVVKILLSNSDIRINKVSKSIEINKGADSLGNKTWGKIDYLTNHCGYTRCIVDSSSRVSNKSSKKGKK